MDLTVGPNHFFWDAATVRGFYQGLAAAPVSRVVLGEVVCSKRLPFWQDEIAPAAERLIAAGKDVAITSLALVTLKRERKATDALAEIGLPIEVNDLTALHAKIGRLTLENDFLEGALTKAGLLSAKR